MSDALYWQDRALGGQSSKSFIDSGRWAAAIELRPDFVLIEFGHNDGNLDPAFYTDPQTTFRANLHRMIVDARAIGAEPVLVTPTGIRYSVDGVHVYRPDTVAPWAEAMAAQAIADEVGLVDLHEATVDLYDAMGITEAQAVLGFEYPAGHPDEAHFGMAGADRLARLIVALLPGASPGLAAFALSSAPEVSTYPYEANARAARGCGIRSETASVRACPLVPTVGTRSCTIRVAPTRLGMTGCQIGAAP